MSQNWSGRRDQWQTLTEMVREAKKTACFVCDRNDLSSIKACVCKEDCGHEMCCGEPEPQGDGWSQAEDGEPAPWIERYGI